LTVDGVRDVILPNSLSYANIASPRWRGILKERLAIVADHLVALGAVTTDTTRTGQIRWFYFGFTAWATARELGWDWPDAATWLAAPAASALLHRGSNTST
jgi:hypothetical protein